MKSDQHKDLENEKLAESDLKVKDFTQKYWGSFTKKGKVQNMYNIFYDRDFKDFVVKTIAERIMTHQKKSF